MWGFVITTLEAQHQVAFHDESSCVHLEALAGLWLPGDYGQNLPDILIFPTSNLIQVGLGVTLEG